MRALLVSVVVSSMFLGCPSPQPECDGGSCDDAGVTQPMTAEEACAAQTNALIDNGARCGRLTAAYAAHWKSRVAATCLGASLDAAHIAAVPACVQQYQTTPCLEEVVCARVGGSLVAGMQCFETSECQADLFCDTSATCPGICRKRIAPGETLKNATEECAEGTYAFANVCRFPAGEAMSCAPMGGGTERQKCAKGLYCTASDVCTRGTAYAALNETCGAQRACGPGLVCKSGTCAQRASAGGACAARSDCLTGLACVGGVCEQFLGTVGETCETATLRFCEEGLFCSDPTSSGVGTCAVLRVSGESCAANSECVESQFCGGTPSQCRPRLVLNATCTAPEECQPTLYCNAGSCTAKKKGGEACVSFDECLSGCGAGVCNPDVCAAQ